MFQEIIEFSQQYKQLITITHVLSVVVGMGGALITDILFIYFAYNKVLSREENKILNLLSKIVTYALVGIVVTGVGIFFSDMVRYEASAKFQTKMTIVVVLIINGILLHKVIFKNLKQVGILNQKDYRIKRRLAFAFGAVSATSWISAMSLGVLDKIPLSYVVAVSIYFLIIFTSIILSQIIYSLYEKSK